MAADFVIRDWRLDPYEGDQAPTHIHHAGEEAFVCLEGDLSVTIDGARTRVPPGGYLIVPRGTPHTFASPGGTHVLAVMSPEIADLIDGLHADLNEAERAALWERCRSSLV
jgi:quercetin dioxygenase-like cupin family protein